MDTGDTMVSKEHELSAADGLIYSLTDTIGEFQIFVGKQVFVNIS